MFGINKKNIGLLSGFIAGALFLDQLSKWLVVKIFGPGPSPLPKEVVGSLLRIKLAYNPYGVFSLSFGHGALYYILGIAGIILFTYIGLKQSRRTKVIIFGLILGGAIGNIVDRLLLGHVIDFIDMGIGDLRWFTYNLADAFVTVGAVVLLLQELFVKPQPQSVPLPEKSP